MIPLVSLAGSQLIDKNSFCATLDLDTMSFTHFSAHIVLGQGTRSYNRPWPTAWIILKSFTYGLLAWCWVDTSTYLTFTSIFNITTAFQFYAGKLSPLVSPYVHCLLLLTNFFCVFRFILVVLLILFAWAIVNLALALARYGFVRKKLIDKLDQENNETKLILKQVIQKRRTGRLSVFHI